MTEPGARDAATNDVQDELLRLANQRLQVMLSQPDAATTTTLDNVMRRLFDRDDRELLTVSAFGSAL
jgi:hypothetical protein